MSETTTWKCSWCRGHSALTTAQCGCCDAPRPAAMGLLADALAERDGLRALVERVEDVVGRLNVLSISAEQAGQVAYAHAAVMVDSVIRGSTDTRPASATAQDAVQGAGDGV